MNALRLLLTPAVLCLAATAPAARDAAGIARAEFLERHARMFDAWDRNQDGVLSPEEHAAMHRAQHGKHEREPARALMHPSK
jgi:hypothetical protein